MYERTPWWAPFFGLAFFGLLVGLTEFANALIFFFQHIITLLLGAACTSVPIVAYAIIQALFTRHSRRKRAKPVPTTVKTPNGHPKPFYHR